MSLYLDQNESCIDFLVASYKHFSCVLFRRKVVLYRHRTARPIPPNFLHSGYRRLREWCVFLERITRKRLDINRFRRNIRHIDVIWQTASTISRYEAFLRGKLTEKGKQFDNYARYGGNDVENLIKWVEFRNQAPIITRTCPMIIVR